MEEISDISGISGEMDYLNPNATSNCPKRRRSTAITEKFGAFLSPWGKRSSPRKLYPWNTHSPFVTNYQIFVSKFGMFFRKILSPSYLDCHKNLMSNAMKNYKLPFSWHLLTLLYQVSFHLTTVDISCLVINWSRIVWTTLKLTLSIKYNSIWHI